MRRVPSDQHHIDEVVGAIDQLITPMEEGVEQPSTKQVAQLLKAIEKLQHWIHTHG